MPSLWWHRHKTLERPKGVIYHQDQHKIKEWSNKIKHATERIGTSVGWSNVDFKDVPGYLMLYDTTLVLQRSRYSRRQVLVPPTDLCKVENITFTTKDFGRQGVITLNDQIQFTLKSDVTRWENALIKLNNIPLTVLPDAEADSPPQETASEDNNVHTLKSNAEQRAEIFLKKRTRRQREKELEAAAKAAETAKPSSSGWSSWTAVMGLSTSTLGRRRRMTEQPLIDVSRRRLASDRLEKRLKKMLRQ